MFRRFTAAAREVVSRAQEEARSLGHDRVGSEHLLLGLLGDQIELPARALLDFDVTLEEARVQVERLFPAGAGALSGELPFSDRAKRALEQALREALEGEDDVIMPEHLLLGLAADPSSGAARVLAEFDVDRHSLRLALERPRDDDDVVIGSDFISPTFPWEGKEALIEIPPAAPSPSLRLPLVVAIVLAAVGFPLGLAAGFLIWG